MRRGGERDIQFELNWKETEYTKEKRKKKKLRFTEKIESKKET
jgi:hypothetical protein